MPDPARENAALEAGHQAIHQKYGTVCRDDSGKVCPILDDVKVIAAGVQAALAELANQWDDLLTTQSEIMTTPQRNAMRNAVAELRLALGQSPPVAAREPCGDPYSGIGCVNPDCTHDGPWVPAPVAAPTDPAAFEQCGKTNDEAGMPEFYCQEWRCGHLRGHVGRCTPSAATPTEEAE